jgi:predicted nucleic acid-binding protein
VCIDASLALKLVLPESDSDRARSLWQKWIAEKVARLAPPLLLSEGLSVIRNRAYRKLLLPEEAEEMSKTFLGLPIHILSPDNLMARTWELATEFNRPNVYDSHYLALAEKMGCELWTADERLFNSVKDKLPWVRFFSQL